MDDLISSIRTGKAFATQESTPSRQRHRKDLSQINNNHNEKSKEISPNRNSLPPNKSSGPSGSGILFSGDNTNVVGTVPIAGVIADSTMSVIVGESIQSKEIRKERALESLAARKEGKEKRLSAHLHLDGG